MCFKVEGSLLTGRKSLYYESRSFKHQLEKRLFKNNQCEGICLQLSLLGVVTDWKYPLRLHRNEAFLIIIISIIYKEIQLL